MTPPQSPQHTARLIVVTGPESSGKSTLAQALAEELDGLLVPEYPRGYLEAAGRKAIASDFAHFAATNEHLVAAARGTLAKRGTPAGYLIQDTGIEVLRLWEEDKFGDNSEALCGAFQRQRPDLYLLSRPDLPWEYDPLRENPHRRDELFRKLRRIIEKQGCPVAEVSGFGESRTKSALRALRSILGK